MVQKGGMISYCSSLTPKLVNRVKKNEAENNYDRAITFLVVWPFRAKQNNNQNSIQNLYTKY